MRRGSADFRSWEASKSNLGLSGLRGIRSSFGHLGASMLEEEEEKLGTLKDLRASINLLNIVPSHY